MAHYDSEKNRFNPDNRFIGDIEDGKRYPFACYTKEESDTKYAPIATSTEVTALTAVVNTKAAQSELTALSGVVDTKAAQSDLTALSGTVSGKASQTDLTTLGGTVSNLSTTVSGKASQSDLDALSDTVATKATQSDLLALSSTVTTKANASDLASLSSVVSTKANQSDLTATNNILATKASQSTVDSLTTTVNSKASQTSVDSLSTIVSTKANQSALDATNAALTSKANSADLLDTNRAIELKANKSDLVTDVENLQNQIDEIVVSASAEAVVAPEVVAARVGSDGEDYSTLKNRLDAENNTVNEKIAITATVGKQYLDKALKQNGYYYLNNDESLIIGGGDDWYFPAITVKSGVTYTLHDVYLNYVIFYDGESYSIVTSDTGTGSMHFTPEADGQLYVTVSKWYIDCAMVTDFENIPNSDTDNLAELSESVKFKNHQISSEKVDFLESNYQYLIKSKATSGKYYNRNAELAADNNTYYIYDGIEVYSGTTYNYTNIDAYHTMFYDYTTASWSALSDSGSTALFTGSFTPSHNGRIFITVKDRAVNYAMFCNGEIPEKPVEGYYNTSIKNKKITVEDTDFATCNHQLITVTGAVQGKYYNRADVSLGVSANRYALVPFKVKAELTYNYSNIDAYYTNVLDLETGVFTPLSNDSTAGASASGTFTPTHDSLIYATIHERDYQKGMFCDGTIPSNYVEGAYNIQLNGDTTSANNIIIVDVNGNGDYTSLREAFESIEIPTTVYIRNGTYNVRSYYTDEEWNAVGFVGLFVPDNATVIGESRDKVIITATDTSSEVKELISTLNIANNATIKNLTVKAKHIRYAVHDDWASAGLNEYKRVIENCAFEGENLRYYTVYGAGTKQGADWSIKNSKFITHDGYRGFSCHNNLNWDKPSKISMINNRFEGNSLGYGISFGSLNRDNTGGDLYVELYGNKLSTDTDKVLLNEETGLGPGIKVYLTGFYNSFDNDDVEIRNSDTHDYRDHVDLF